VVRARHQAVRMSFAVALDQLGGAHDNFGVGAKIASLPWNPEGVVVISYKGGKPSMMQIELDPDSADYQLVEFQSERGTAYVINPADVDWQEELGKLGRKKAAA
jgi:hypothetical protein